MYKGACADLISFFLKYPMKMKQFGLTGYSVGVLWSFAHIHALIKEL